MKILVTTYGYLTPSMTFIHNQIEALEKQGHIIAVVACKRENEELFPFKKVHVFEEIKDFSYLYSGLKRKTGINFTYQNSGFSRKLKTFIQNFQPDVIHCHFGTHFFRIWETVKKTKTPVLITFHGYDASVYLRDKTYCRALQNAFKSNQVFATAVSEAVKKNLVKAGLPEDKITVDYLGIDIEFFKRETPKPEVSQNSTTFLQVSNFVEKKGHEFTIKAFKKHLESTLSNDKLIFGGAGPLLQNMKSLTEELGISANIRFVGLVDRHQVKNLMENADFFVHHSVTASDGDQEGLPTVLMEAMAMELPCISTIHAGIPEIITDRENGILVAEKDIDAMAIAFTSIKSLSCSPRKTVTAKFDIHKNTQTISAIFEGIIQKNVKAQ